MVRGLLVLAEGRAAVAAALVRRVALGRDDAGQAQVPEVDVELAPRAGLRLGPGALARRGLPAPPGPAPAGQPLAQQGALVDLHRGEPLLQAPALRHEIWARGGAEASE